MNASQAASSSAHDCVVVEQVRLGRHQVGLGDTHRRLRAALRLGVGRHTGGDRHPVVVADLRRSTGAARRPRRRDRPSRCVRCRSTSTSGRRRRRASPDPDSRSTSATCGPRSAITTRNRHHANQAQNRFVARPADASGPVPSPTAPTSPAPGSTADTPAAARPDSCPSPPPPPGAPCAPTRRTPSPRACRRPRRRGSCRSSAPPTPPPSARCGSINLARCCGLAASGETALVAQRHVVLDGVMRAAGQLGRRPERPRQVERFQNLHDLLVRLHSFLPDRLALVLATGQSSREEHRGRGPRRCDQHQRGQFCWPPVGNSDGHQRAVS